MCRLCQSPVFIAGGAYVSLFQNLRRCLILAMVNGPDWARMEMHDLWELLHIRITIWLVENIIKVLIVSNLRSSKDYKISHSPCLKA